MHVKAHMKRIVIIVLALTVGLSAMGQGQVTTKKYRLADFSDKVTKIVLSGNSLLDGALRQEILNVWTISAFEFCTVDEFHALKTQDLYYFLIAAESRFKGEETPGILFLTLVKGGPEAGEGIAAMPEVISLVSLVTVPMKTFPALPFAAVTVSNSPFSFNPNTLPLYPTASPSTVSVPSSVPAEFFTVRVLLNPAAPPASV